jgi:hypothetical protein
MKNMERVVQSRSRVKVVQQYGHLSESFKLGYIMPDGAQYDDNLISHRSSIKKSSITPVNEPASYRANARLINKSSQGALADDSQMGSQKGNMRILDHDINKTEMQRKSNARSSVKVLVNKNCNKNIEIDDINHEFVGMFSEGYLSPILQQNKSQ